MVMNWTFVFDSDLGFDHDVNDDNKHERATKKIKDRRKKESTYQAEIYNQSKPKS